MFARWRRRRLLNSGSKCSNFFQVYILWLTDSYFSNFLSCSWYLIEIYDAAFRPRPGQGSNPEPRVFSHQIILIFSEGFSTDVKKHSVVSQINFKLKLAVIVLAQMWTTRLVTERSWVRIPPGVGLFSLLCPLRSVPFIQISKYGKF